MCNYVAVKKNKNRNRLTQTANFHTIIYLFYKLVSVLNFGLNVVYEFHIFGEIL